MTLYNRNKVKITITGSAIAGGGEGEIFMSPSSKNKVIKVYHTPRPQNFETTLQKLATLNTKFIKPGEIYYTSKGLVAGFEMKFVNFNKYFLLNNLFNKGFTNKNNITPELKQKVLSEIKTSVEDCHNKDIIIGDLNQYNIFFNLNGEVLFIDVDSYSEKNNVKTDVLLEDIKDWTQNEINEKSDYFAFDVLSFWALTYCHPFKWVVPGNSETLQQRVLSGKSFLSNIPNIKIPPLYQEPATNLKNQFIEIFEKKRRFMIEFDKVVQPINIQVAIPSSISSQDVNIKFIDDGVDIRFSNSYLCLKKGKFWQVYDVRHKGSLIAKKIIECDDLFLSENHYCYLKNNKIYSETGEELLYDQESCIYYYQNEQLLILNSEEDEALVYQIENNVSRVENLKHIVFAASFNLRSSLIQNFGAIKKVVNLHNKNLSLINIPTSTKDVIINKNFYVAEYIEKGKILTALFKLNGLQADKVIYVDNLVEFAVLNDFIFIPKDGSVDIYQSTNLIQSLNVPVSTKNSKLHYTPAGIILFENNKLYLLNK